MMGKKEKYDQMAKAVLEKVGGKANVTFVTHCMTRLRFNLKDNSVVNMEEMKQIDGVIGAQFTGTQLQIILGPAVEEVYKCVCNLGNFETTEMIQEDLEAPKEKLTLKKIGSNILDGIAGCMTPLIPILVASSLFKVLTTILGPTLLNVIDETSDLYTLFTFVGDTGFYFMPIIAGYAAAKKFKVTPVLGIFLGAVMLHPTFMQLAGSGTSFTVYGIPATPVNYANTLLPIIASVWVMSYVEKFLKKYIPANLHLVFVPTLTLVIMLPITLCLLGPAGYLCSNAINNLIMGLSNQGGILTILAIAVIGALWQLLVLTGMHVVVISTLMVVFTTGQQDAVILPGMMVAGLAVYGMCIGALIRVKNKKERSLIASYFIALAIGGVTEPAMFGLGLKYKRPLLGMIAGGFAGGIVSGLLRATTYALVPVANFLHVASWFGGSLGNTLCGLFAELVSVVVAAVVTYFFGFSKEDLKVLGTNE